MSSDPSASQPPRPLKMRNLRAGRSKPGAEQQQNVEPPATSGRTEDLEQFHSALSYAIGRMQPQVGTVVVFRVGCRLVRLDPWADEATFCALETSVDAVVDVLSNLDDRLVFLMISPTEALGFLADASRLEAERIMGRVLSSLSGVLPTGSMSYAMAPQLGAAFVEDQISAGHQAVDAATLTLSQTSTAAPFLMYNAYVQQRSEREQATANALPEAVAGNEIELAFQPRAATSGNRLVGVEAFARWHHETLGTVPPAEFLRLATNQGLMPDLGRRLRDRAAGAAVAWFRDGSLPEGRLWLNMSEVELCHPDFHSSLLELRDRYPEVAIGIEIRDSPILDEAVVTGQFDPLRQMGIDIVLDNVSPATMSLNRLQRLPLAGVNLDGSVAHFLVSDPVHQHFAVTVCEIAHSRGITVTACQAETREQLTAARKLGIDQVQGNVLAAPVKAAQMAELLSNGISSVERRGIR